MLSLIKCRELLGDSGKKLSDEQVLALRDQLYVLADVIVDIYDERQREKVSRNDDS